MISFLPAPLVGIIGMTLYTLTIIIWFFLLSIATFVRYLVPNKHWRIFFTKFANQLPIYWADSNHLIQWLTTRTAWEVHGFENIKPNDWYLMICNHQSYVDIVTIQRITKHKIPLPKFFMKKELLWQLPFASWCCWMLDYPFMNRYGKEILARHPELKGKDIAATKKSCERFKDTPTTVINFLEGTRFTPEKHQRQHSPYKHLLKPKAGGIAFALAVLGKEFHKIINLTIIYPEGKINGWNFLCGKVKKIIVHAELLEITPDLLGDYENDREFRIYFQNYLNKLWQQKDKLIDKALAKNV